MHLCITTYRSSLMGCRKQQVVSLKMLLFLITACAGFALQFTNLPSILWLFLYFCIFFFTVCVSVVKCTDPVENHYSVQ